MSHIMGQLEISFEERWGIGGSFPHKNVVLVYYSLIKVWCWSVIPS
ncbi:MAG: hypothetical protein J6X26_06445 [Bacteroidales bacterium]|nr:hypothetical protein [Bacteroidales bacterium]